MSEPQNTEHRSRRSGGNNNNRRRQNSGGNRDDRPRTEHETYRREGGPTDYTPPRERPERPERDRPKTFGGGEYERVYRDKPAPKAPIGKRILKFISFGLLGGDKKPAPPASNGGARGSRPEGRGDRPRNDRDRDRRGGERREGGRRGEGQARGERSERPPRPERPKREPAAPREPREPREPRPPQPVDLESITTARLHVGNLSYDTTESDLFTLFNTIGKVTNAEIVSHTRTQRSKGFGFVSLTSLEDAKRAASELHGKPFMGRAITVGSAKGPKPEGARRERDERDERPDQDDSEPVT
jgi:hypothetical protein